MERSLFAVILVLIGFTGTGDFVPTDDTFCLENEISGRFWIDYYIFGFTIGPFLLRQYL